MNTTDTLTAVTRVQALSAAIRALAQPQVEGASTPTSLAETGLHVQALADLASEAAEGLLDAY